MSSLVWIKVNQVKIKMGGFERLLVWCKATLGQIGIGPIVSLSSLLAALVAAILGANYFEAAALQRQLSEERTTYESTLRQMEDKLEEQIPEGVRSPVPVFPKNGISLIFPTTNAGETMDLDLELEWVDRDRKHRRKYLVQVVCIAEIPRIPDDPPPGISQANCGTDRLYGDTSDKGGLYWTQPGESRREVKITQAGTYVWRVARGELDGTGKKTIYEEWSPYFIFTVFESIEKRVKVMKEVQIGIGAGSLLEKKVDEVGQDNNRLANIEKYLVDKIQEKHFKLKEEQKRYLSYPTYEALIEGVVKGEVDYAIGEITPTEDRERLGICFTRGYKEETLPIFVKGLRTRNSPGKGDLIGVLSGTSNEQALEQLKQTERFTTVSMPFLQDLQRILKAGTVNFIFAGAESVNPLLNLKDSSGNNKFASDNMLSGKVRDFYKDHFRHSPEYSIATATGSLCKKLDKLVEEHKGGYSNFPEQ